MIDWDLRFRLGIGDWDWGWALEIGIGDWDWGSGLGIEIGDWNWVLRLGIGGDISRTCHEGARNHVVDLVPLGEIRPFNNTSVISRYPLCLTF